MGAIWNSARSYSMVHLRDYYTKAAEFLLNIAVDLVLDPVVDHESDLRGSETLILLRVNGLHVVNLHRLPP